MRRKETTSDMMEAYLVGGLFQLMEKKPFAEITISEIAERAGVNRSTYYRHFSRKEDIIVCLIDGLMNEYISEIDRHVSLEQYLLRLFLHFSRYKKELLLLYDNGLSGILLDVMNRYFRALSCEVEVSLTENYRLAYHVGGVYNHLLLWFSRKMSDSPEEMSRMASRVFPADFKPFLLRSCKNSYLPSNICRL